MAFDTIKENADNIQEEVQTYIEKSASYYKLWVFKVAMKSTTMILKLALIILCFTMILLFGSIAAALAIGVYFDSYAIGFISVAAFYLVATFILYFVKELLIEKPILEKFSEIFFND
jgi:sterol desaturase/sphingolipid hydroxylase (fatty acid hydroxylase superfamily)